eukprot:scaffold659_cov260-Chaetoceros_neogracile.AAC.6
MKTSQRIVLYLGLIFLRSSISTTSAFSPPNHGWAHLDRVGGSIYRTFTIIGLSTSNGHFDLTSLLKDKRSKPKEELLTQSEIQFIDTLVKRRSDARAKGDYGLADIMRDTINAISEKGGCAVTIPEGYKIEVKDVPRNEGGESLWSLQPKARVQNDLVDVANSEDENNNVNRKDVSVLGLAHSALGLASSSSERGVPIDHDKLNEIVLKAKRRLKQTGEQELRGRKAADAAFWFALSGVRDDSSIGIEEGLDFSLFEALTFICLEEIMRFGERPSCRAMDIMHIVERIAASGVSNDTFRKLQKAAAKCLETKEVKDIEDLVRRGVVEILHQGKFELHSERSLLWIWRFSTRQRKQRAFLKSAAKHWDSQTSGGNTMASTHNNPDIGTVDTLPLDWTRIFKDPTLPLVVDIGCGMGVSILGLSTLDEIDKTEDATFNLDWSKCNFLGADLSNLGINFASSITARWDLRSNVHFTVGSAEDVMDQIKDSYPGSVELCMIQFPTPFRFKDKSDEGLASVVNQGNQQLPTDAFSGFMVTQRLLESVRNTLNPECGRLLLQSNVEDVAVFMNKLASDISFETLPAEKCVEKIEEGKDGMPQRTQKWISLGSERAKGLMWSAETFLPSKKGATETEVACSLNGTPVHRVLLKPK